MSQELKIDSYSDLDAFIDINQPGLVDEAGVYQDGPVIGRIIRGDGNLPEGTLLHGQLWTGPGIYEKASEKRAGIEKPVEIKVPAVMGRYTLAILPDGRKFPVCIVLGNPDGLYAIEPGPKAGTFVLSRGVPVSAVERWPPEHHPD